METFALKKADVFCTVSRFNDLTETADHSSLAIKVYMAVPFPAAESNQYPIISCGLSFLKLLEAAKNEILTRQITGHLF
ncbi:hypothetical protein ACQKLP_16635 [Chitinophaga sp. NPDC101104]|uniref:hypothetical protein n=1 Tax=Chitinophaga sp. NPDC101104 TaxID=3390561 RepID=UPI003D030636